MAAASDQNRGLHDSWSLAGAPVRARGPVDQSRLTLGPPSRNPAVGALTRDAELLGHMSDRATITHDPLDQQTTTMNIQTGVSVGHEDLLGQWLT